MKVDNSVYRYYLIDLVSLLKRKAKETIIDLNQIKANPDQSKDDIMFQSGRFMAYQEVLTTMMHQLETFQIPLKEVNFDKVDQDLLLCDKPVEENKEMTEIN